MTTKIFLSTLNEEKRKIVQTDGNVLVIANPGTGKTLLLAYKFAWLLKNGLRPEDLLCLTFTNKAKKELEERIIKLIQEQKIDVDVTKLNIHTFHSYTFDSMEDDEIISSNLLRYSVYKYLKSNEILNYSDEYLLSSIVPKMENLLRYLKNFGLMPEKINLSKSKSFLVGDDKYGKDELDSFSEGFIDIFKHYEEVKSKKGIDYTDMLLNFLKNENPKKFKYVLVDELQDVNTIEAEIALKSAENFVAVGDKKQAIFGFQGGSIINFQRFSNSTQFILSENFRSSNEVLDYAKEDFISKTKDSTHKKDLENLKNNHVEKGEKPLIYEVEKENINRVVCELIKKLSKDYKKVAIIARTNSQIMNISKELKKRGIDHSSTYFSASTEAKDKIITFLKGLLSNDVQIVKNSMFTPFFPVSIQKAFEIAADKIKTLEDFYKICPEFQRMRESIKTITDLDKIFQKAIMPISINYGKEFLMACLSVQSALKEAIKVMDTLDLRVLIDYIKSSDLLIDGYDAEKNVIVTSVHKSKGKEYDCVVYIPVKTRNNVSFQDKIVEAILKAHGINAKEELEEEALRIDFVAFTRTKSKLCIVTEKIQDYMNNNAQSSDIETEPLIEFETAERVKRAYNLFINKEYEKAKELLETDNSWVVNYIKAHFDNLQHLSFSRVTDDPYKYLIKNILLVADFTTSTNLGSRAHEIAEKICLGKECEVDAELLPYKENIDKMIEIIKKNYPDVVNVEDEIKVPLSKIVSTDENLLFKGYIDAVFKNKNQYLIIDWKTDKKDDRASEHRQQLEAYKRAYSIKHSIPTDKIKVAICFIGLRKTINTGVVEYLFDDKQPAKSAFETFQKKVLKILSWKKDPKSFLNQLSEKEQDDEVWRAVVEQYKREGGVK